MSTLHLVRHGQASFFSDNYDELSDIGRQQSRRLAEYWTSRGVAFDRVFCGPRVRQIDTVNEIRDVYASAGRSLPEIIKIDGLDEYAAEEVLEQALPALLESDPRIRELHRRFDATEGRSERQRAFQRMYEVVMDRWAAGEVPVDGVENWTEFRERTHAAFLQIAEQSPAGSRVMAVTSGGPIGIAVERATGMPPTMALRTAWMVRNAAVSEFLFSGERFTMSTFNALGHLDDDPAMLTYR